MKSNNKNVYHIHSDNDNIFNNKFFSAYIKRTNAEETIIPNAGHFGRPSGVKEIGEIKEILKSIDNY